VRLRGGVGGERAGPPWPPGRGLAAGGWLVLTLSARGIAFAPLCGAWFSPATSLSLLLALNPLPSATLGWLVMLLAMLPPLLVLPMVEIWRGSLHRNRVAKCGLFVLGYGAVWLAAGLPALVWLALAQAMPQSLLVAILATLLWQVSPWRQSCLNACHNQRRLSAFGRAALGDALREGARLGGWCVLTGLPLMTLAMMGGAMSVTAMFLATLALTIERLLPPAAPRWLSLGESLGLRLRQT